MQALMSDRPRSSPNSYASISAPWESYLGFLYLREGKEQREITEKLTSEGCL
jgi:hypothetical protein